MLNCELQRAQPRTGVDIVEQLVNKARTIALRADTNLRSIIGMVPLVLVPVPQDGIACFARVHLIWTKLTAGTALEAKELAVYTNCVRC